jgi:hypothetical protein
VAVAHRTEQRSILVPGTVLVAALAVQLAAVTGAAMSLVLALAVGAVGGAALIRRGGLEWSTLLAVILALVLAVPIHRYTLPGALPFRLEPYRLAVALTIALWISALLIDRRVRLRRTGLEAPLGLLLAATVASVVVNGDRVSELGGDVAKSLTFFASFLLVFLMFVSVVRSRRVLRGLVQLLVGGGAIVAALTVYESRTGYNVFDHLSELVPGLNLTGTPYVPERGGLARAYGSGQHPIPTGAAFVMLIPLAIYLIASSSRKLLWGAAGLLLLLGSLATVSRTSVIMLAALALVFLWLRPRETKRVAPLLIPLLIVVHIALPDTISTLKSSFFPEGGLVAENSGFAGTRGSARLADVGPALEDFRQQPFVGKGYGTFIVEEGRANAPILDNQWLGTLLEIGAVGAIAWFWLIARAVRLLGRRAREDLSADGLLAAGIASSVTAFAIGMLTYDAFAFIQVTFLFFILLGLGCALLHVRKRPVQGTDDAFATAARVAGSHA